MNITEWDDFRLTEYIDLDGARVEVSGNQFKSFESGTFLLKAVAGDIVSNEIEITVIEEQVDDLQATGLNVRHVEGQTFITWQEINKIIPSNVEFYEFTKK